MSRKDWLGGLLMLVFGASVAGTARGYGVGTLTSMGAGYFPLILGCMLAVVGVLMLAGAVGRRFSAVSSKKETVHRGVDWRGAACIVASIIAFVIFGTYSGLLIASFLVVFISALGDRANSWRAALVIALSMTVVSVVVFWWALRLQMPLVIWGS